MFFCLKAQQPAKNLGIVNGQRYRDKVLEQANTISSSISTSPFPIPLIEVLRLNGTKFIAAVRAYLQKVGRLWHV